MKTILSYLLGLAVMLTVSSCNSSNEEAPLSVQHVFEAKYEKAHNVKWSKINPQEWQANFTINEKAYKVHFTPEGKWRETNYTIGMADIPESVKLKLAKEYEGYKIKKAEVSESPDGVYYEFKLLNNGKLVSLILDSDGLVVSNSDESV